MIMKMLPERVHFMFLTPRDEEVCLFWDKRGRCKWGLGGGFS